MLYFKARQRRDPTASPFMTPSQRRIMNMLRDAMNEVRDAVSRDEGKLLDALMHKPIDEILDLVPVDPWVDVQEALAEELLGDLTAAGHRYGKQIPSVEKAMVTFQFDDTRPEAAAWARNRAGTMISQITQGQRQVVRDFVEASSLAGAPPREVARNLRNTIGLTTEQAGWVRNFNARKINEYIDQGLSPSQAASRAVSATQRYHDRVHRYRTESIARTEILSASHEGRRQSWAQGIQQGYISPNSMQQWSAELDGRNCQICAGYDGTRVPIGAQFPGGDPPVHPMCRCDVLLIDAPAGDATTMTTREMRPGMGDSITVNDDEFNEMMAYSGRNHIVGRTPDGVPIFSEKRQAIHDRILESVLQGVDPSDAPALRMTGGGPASGKGGVVDDLAERMGSAAKIDPDKVKAALPEYTPMVKAGDEFAAAFTHEESSYLAKRILQAAAERRVNIIYDGTGNGSPASLIAKIETARANGYRVTGHYVTIDTDEAIRRANLRAERSGRKVPETTIRTTHAKVSQIWDTAVEAFDEVELYDNNVEMRLIANATRGGNVRVLDREAYDGFVRKGEG